MGFRIIQADLTELAVDAIVNPTDYVYSGGGGLDEQIHEKCGQPLDDATRKLPRLHFGQARATASFGLPCKHIIHTSGPYWEGVSELETDVLGSCYRNSVALADKLGCKSIAFPLVSSQGKFFPKEVALDVAIDAINECVVEYPKMDIVLAIYGRWTSKLPPSFFETISRRIAKIHSYCSYNESCESINVCQSTLKKNFDIGTLIEHPTQKNVDSIPVEESFGEMLDRLLTERKIQYSKIQDEIGMSAPGFWKLRTGKTNPNRLTVFAIAIALNLSIDDTEEMLMKAGYAINKSSIQDMVLSELIRAGIYDRYIIDDLLYALELQALPGAVD